MISIGAWVLLRTGRGDLPTSNIVGQDFMVRKVLLQRNAAGHDGRELHVVHCAAAGVGREILFQYLFSYPSDAGRGGGAEAVAGGGLLVFLRLFSLPMG